MRESWLEYCVWNLECASVPGLEVSISIDTYGTLVERLVLRIQTLGGGLFPLSQEQNKHIEAGRKRATEKRNQKNGTTMTEAVPQGRHHLCFYLYRMLSL